MLVKRTDQQFPGTALLLRGTSLFQTWPYLLGLTALGSIVGVGHEFGWVPSHATVSLIPFSLVGLALSIFLGFRNNACYDRWWEGRKLWGLLINTTRSVARDVDVYIDDVDFHREITRRTIGFAYALKYHLRTETSLDFIQPFLPADDYEALKSEPNVPNAVLQQMSLRFRDVYQEGRLHAYHLSALQGLMLRLADIQGGCERIKNTPVPLSYTVLTHRIVGLYCAALPFGIVDEVGLYTPIVTLIVSFAFLGLDAVGTQIEDPFELDPNDLPLYALARTIERDLKARIGEEIPPPIAPVHGILE